MKGVGAKGHGTLLMSTCELTDLVAYFDGPPAGVDFYVDDVEVRRQAP